MSDTDGGQQVDLGGETVGDEHDGLVNTRDDGERLLLVECPLCGADWRAAFEAGRWDHDDVKTHLRGHDHERFFETTSVEPERQPRGDGQQRLVPDGGHDPTEFGLAPCGEVRRRSSADIWGDQTPPWEGQR